MGIPYGKHTTCKEGSFELGISLSEFMDLVDKGEIEVSSRGGGNLLVNDDTLDSYILKYGGRLDRYNEFIVTETELLQETEILKYTDLILSSAPRGKGRDNLKIANWSSSTISEICVNYYTGNEILKFSKLVKQRKNNRATLNMLYSLGFTDNTLNKYFKDSSFDYEKNNIRKKYWVVFQEKVHNGTFTFKSLNNFFNSYKVFEKRYLKIDFLTKSQKHTIVEKANKKFGY